MRQTASIGHARRGFLAVCVGIFMIGTGGLFVPEYDKFTTEALAPVPKWNHPSSFAPYVRDHFGFRRSLAGIGNVLSIAVLRRPLNQYVILGKDGWLFFAPLPGKNEPHIFSDAELSAWREYFEGRRTWFQSHGMRYVIVIVPDKQSIYPEFAPVGFLSGGPTMLQQLQTYLRLHSTVRVIDPTPALLELKQTTLAYYPHDTHWNSAGAFAAYRFIAGVDVLDLPEPRTLSGITLVTQKQWRDFYQLLSIDWAPAEYEEIYSVLDPQAQFLSHSGAILTYATQRKDRSNALIFGDSFFNSLKPFIVEHFHVSTYVSMGLHHVMRKEDIHTANPELVIEEIAERMLSSTKPDLDAWMQAENME